MTDTPNKTPARNTGGGRVGRNAPPASEN
jgi:hypothetical protein